LELFSELIHFLQDTKPLSIHVNEHSGTAGTGKATGDVASTRREALFVAFRFPQHKRLVWNLNFEIGDVGRQF
jgi:hypothetical protein